MDASQLSIQQVSSIRENLQQELEHLTESFSQLRQAQTKFSDCAQSVNQLGSECAAGKEILVPLTSSLYVPGKVVDPTKFLVDVGTDYFVEKNTAETCAFFNHKVETLNKNLVDLDKLVNEKVKSLQTIEQLLTQKITQARKQQPKAEPGAEA